MVVLLALIAGGGMRQATSAVNGLLVKAEDATTQGNGPKNVPDSPGQTQYRPGKGCGDRNHIHERNFECKASPHDTSVKEGNSGTSFLTFTVTLDDAPLSAVTVGYATANGTATAGSDYTARSGTLLFDVGQTTQTVSVPVIGDKVVESNETVLLNLTSSSPNATSSGQGIGTIVDDDKK
jgi:hypothetical protein